MSSKPEKIDKDIKEALIKRAYGYEYEDKVIADSTGRAEKVKNNKASRASGPKGTKADRLLTTHGEVGRMTELKRGFARNT